jgi:hypothetical protein
MSRMYVDCREQPSESRCSLKISGEPDEVVRAASEHAAAVHGHANTPELREMIRSMLKEDTSDVKDKSEQRQQAHA